MSKGTRLLVVEDERIVAEDIRRNLENLGYTVIGTVDSGEAALEKVEKCQPDLVVMDIVIHGKITGIETAELIRSRHQIPVIYLTAYADIDTLNKAKITEPFGYIVKPFNDRELQGTIEMALYKCQMEKRLRESEARFRRVAEKMIDGLVIVEDGEPVYVNDRICAITGYSRDELMKMTPLELIDSEHMHRMEQVFKDYYDTGQLNQVLEAEIQRKDGERYYVQNRYSKYVMDNGAPGYYVMVTNITQRKKAEEALRISEERHRGLFESMGQGVLYCDAKGLITNVNPAAQKILQTPAEKMTGVDIKKLSFHLVKEDDSPYPLHLRPSQLIIQTGESIVDRIVGVQIPGGQKKWLLVSATPVFNRKDHALSSFFLTFSDITRRREAELTLQQRNIQLNWMNTFARTVSGSLEIKEIMDRTLKAVQRLGTFSAVLFFIFPQGSGGLLLRVFDGMDTEKAEVLASSLFRSGFLQTDYSGKETAICFPFDGPEWGKQRITGILGKMLRGKHCLLIPVREGKNVLGGLALIAPAEKIPWENDLGFYSGIGSYIELVIRNARLYDETDRTLKELRVTQDKLVETEKLAGLGSMAGHVVHEIGNPLAAIMNSAQVLQSHVKLEGRMKELLDIIGWESERLSRSVEMLREFSKPRRMNKRESNLKNVIDRAISVMNQDIELMWNRKMHTKISGSVPDILLDPEAMEQVLLNLLRNALQAVDEGGDVWVRLKKEKKKWAVLEVEDNGRGIAPEIKKKVFEPYFSTKGRGMGLGMHIVKNIVDAHDGTVELRSEPGKGSLVRIRIPLRGEKNG
jgi:PAS domain S-box-containing protein